MNGPPTSSLVVATYNWPGALELCLESILRQVQLPGEVLIADDGSGAETRLLVQRYAAKFPVPLIHVWHPDTGFRLAQIRNKANARTKGEYILQIDGDLILHPHFVKDHLAASEPGYFIGGSRVLLSRQLSQRIFDTHSFNGNILKKGVQNELNGIYFPLAGKVLSELVITSNAYNVRGCNMSYWKKDFIAVNGYNDAYKGWGREDTDLVFRFYFNGLKRKYFKLRGIAYHIWHKEADRERLNLNDAILERTLRTRLVRCGLGIDQYL